MEHPLRKAFLFRTTIQYVIKCSLVQMMCFEEVITCCESLHALTFSWEELLGIIGGTCAVSVCKELAPVGAEYLQSREVRVWEGKDGAGPGCKGS